MPTQVETAQHPVSDVSIVRLYALRLLYLLNFLFVGTSAGGAIIRHEGAWDPVKAVAFCFWAALALLSGLGIRYPLKMVPVLLMQLVYKTIWMLGIYLPMDSDAGSGLLPVMAAGAIADLLVIPWGYVLSEYVKAPANRWR